MHPHDIVKNRRRTMYHLPAQNQKRDGTHLASVAAVERLDVLFVSPFDGGERTFTVVAHIGFLTR